MKVSFEVALGKGKKVVTKTFVFDAYEMPADITGLFNFLYFHNAQHTEIEEVEKELREKFTKKFRVI